MPATSLIPRGLLLAALLGGAALPGFAQGVGEIRGNVLDSTGAILPGATVTVSFIRMRACPSTVDDS